MKDQNSHHILRIVVFLLLLSCFTAGCSAQSNRENFLEDSANSYEWKNYKAVIAFLQAQNGDRTDPMSGYGLVCDVNDDRIEDMILMYEAKFDSEICWVCSVFSLSDSSVTALLWEEKIGKRDDLTYAYVALAEMEGKPCLVTLGEKTSRSSGDSKKQRGIWHTYRFETEGLVLENTVEYTQSIHEDGFVNYILYQNAKINGETVSFEDYEDWLSRLGIFYGVDTNGLRRSDCAFDMADSEQVELALKLPDSWYYRVSSYRGVRRVLNGYHSSPGWLQSLWIIGFLTPVAIAFLPVYIKIRKKKWEKYRAYNRQCLQDIPEYNLSNKYRSVRKPARLRRRVKATNALLITLFVAAVVAPPIVFVPAVVSEVTEYPAIEVVLGSVIAVIVLVISAISCVALLIVCLRIVRLCRKIFVSPASLRITKYTERELRDDQ